MSLALAISFIVPIAFLIIVPLFLYYSLQSLFAPDASVSFDRIVSDHRIPDFLVCHNSDRRKSATRNYKSRKARNNYLRSSLAAAEKLREKKYCPVLGILFVI